MMDPAVWHLGREGKGRGLRGDVPGAGIVGRVKLCSAQCASIDWLPNVWVQLRGKDDLSAPKNHLFAFHMFANSDTSEAYF